MSGFNVPPDLNEILKDIKARLQSLANSRNTPQYTTATRPTASTVAGLVIYVTDGAAGSQFQGSNGTSWVSLG